MARRPISCPNCCRWPVQDDKGRTGCPHCNLWAASPEAWALLVRRIDRAKARPRTIFTTQEETAALRWNLTPSGPSTTTPNHESH